MKTLAILLLFPFLCQAIEINCDSLKVGLFKLNSEDNSLHTITRTKEKQTENISKTGLISEFDIKWTSNCTYLLYNRRVISGKDNIPEGFKIDTLYNEIIEITGDSHKTISYMKGYDFKVEATLVKIDTLALYRDISNIEKFKEYNGTTRGGTLIGDNHSVAYRQNTLDKQEYIIAFQETFSINHKAKFKLLDYVKFKMKENENLATSNCRFNDKYDKEVIAIYTSKNEKEEAKIKKAWRFNRHTLKIEPVDKSKVKYKVADKNSYFRDK